MDHCYVISSSNENYVLSKAFIDKHRNNITIVAHSDQKHESKLTQDIYKHINTLNRMSIDKFNWQYYCNKYNDLQKINKK